MRKIILYIATSLDGYIARENGDIDWLEKFEKSGENYGYQEFYKTIDITIMGNKTYNQVLGFGEFPYKDKRNYVLTRRKDIGKAKFVEYVNQNIIEFIKNLKGQEGKDIWLIGGAEIVELLHNSELIDEYIIFIMPVSLGKGIPLFTQNANPSNFKLRFHKAYKSGVVHLVYEKFLD